jgi:hypothetical protein
MYCGIYVQSIYMWRAGRVDEALVYGMIMDICHGFESYQNLVTFLFVIKHICSAAYVNEIKSDIQCNT